jgi:hypothetical protein
VSATGIVALLGLGLALIARHTATAITTTLGLLYLAPVVALFVTDPVWQERIRRYAPLTADRWLFAAFTVGVLVLAAILFRRRDA